MAYLKNKLLEKQRKYLRRKQRVNTQVKGTNPEYRVIITRSLMHVTADVISADGKVVATCTDKGRLKLKEQKMLVLHLQMFLNLKRLQQLLLIEMDISIMVE